MPLPVESPEAIEDCLEAHLCRHTGRTSAIYWLILLLVCGGIAALPLIEVAVAIEARGVIRPALDKHEVVSGTAGMVGEVLTRENQFVAAGDPLVRIVAESVQGRLRLLDDRLRDTEESIHDLLQLVGSREDPSGQEPTFVTSWIREEIGLYVDQLESIDSRAESLGRELERATHLFSMGLISRAELERHELAVASVSAERTALRGRQRVEWQARLAASMEGRGDLLAQRALLAADSSFHTIRAPVAGTIEQLAKLSPGSYVRLGQSLAVVSPRTDLVAEVLVPSSRFGLIQVGMTVRLLVDAFHYADWGFLLGRVVELPDDYILVDNIPVFRTIVEIPTTRLGLANGTRRDVSKGMTLTARFMVAERSLWSLIREDVNDWFNPSQPPE